MNPRTTTLDAAAVTRLRNFLGARYGLTQAQLNQAVGSTGSGLTRAQVAANLAAWLRDRPKG